MKHSRIERKEWQQMEDKIALILKQVDKAGWTSLSENEQDLVALWTLEKEMHRGGFIHFFCNGGNACLTYARRCLSKMGAKKCLQVIVAQFEIIACIANGFLNVPPRDIPVYLSDEELELLNLLDVEYCKHSQGIWEKMLPLYESWKPEGHPD
ncbi:MAG: DUF4375 domain-containing protein [Niabella sp.]|nr:DUF4375 domain-containing protein [Niabella sp.]